MGAVTTMPKWRSSHTTIIVQQIPGCLKRCCMVDHMFGALVSFLLLKLEVSSMKFLIFSAREFPCPNACRFLVVFVSTEKGHFAPRQLLMKSTESSCYQVVSFGNKFTGNRQPSLSRNLKSILNYSVQHFIKGHPRPFDLECVLTKGT